MNTVDLDQKTKLTGVSVAAGIPIFQRSNLLYDCLQSIAGSGIQHVIVADNGDVEDRTSIYDADWPFELTVLDLEYDCGIGQCRASIAEHSDEEYLLVTDSDMIFPDGDDLQVLLTLLQEDDDLGGVSGWLIEENTVRDGCSNLYEHQLYTGQQILLRDIRSQPEIEYSNGFPYVRFDYLPNATLFKRECIDTYSWDAEMPIKEHIEFYIGHMKKTDWQFASCPSVTFFHRKGESTEYRTNVRGGDHYLSKRKEALRNIRDKWGYDQIIKGSKTNWIESANRSFSFLAGNAIQALLPEGLSLQLKYWRQKEQF